MRSRSGARVEGYAARGLFVGALALLSLVLVCPVEALERLRFRRMDVDLKVPRFARSVVGGDFTGDSAPDLVVGSRATSGASTLSLLAQEGDGGFAEPVPFDGGRRLAHLVPADIDGDGDLDLVAAVDAALGVFLGSSGSFSELQSYPLAEASPQFVAVADVDGDGALDVVAVQTDVDRVQILTGAGDGSFTATAAVSTSSQPTSAVLADVDRDGRDDLVVSHRGSDSIGVLPGDGTGGFGEGIDRPVDAARPFRVLAVNLGSGEGVDIVVATASSVTLLGGATPEDLSPRATIAVSATANSIVAIDVESDGDEDLVLGFKSSDQVTFLRNDGASQLASECHDDLPRSEALVVLDFDGDGDQDLASVVQTSVGVALQDGTLEVPEYRTAAYPAGGTPHGLALGDLDADADLDVVTANNTPDPGISLFFNGGDGTFDAFEGLSPGGTPFSIALADFDGDGDLDLAAGDEGGGIGTNRLRMVSNDGSGRFLRGADFEAGGVIRHVVAGDLDGDGAPDVVTTNSSSNSATVFVNNGSGVFERQFDLMVGSGPSSASLGDLDGDRLADIVVSNQVSSTLTVFLGQGAGQFGEARSLPVLGKPTFVALGDVDGNTFLDLVTANETSASVEVIWNEGGGILSPPFEFLEYIEPHSLSLSDLDGDGHLEVLTANQASDSLSALYWGGDRVLEGSVPHAVGMQPRFASAGDLDADDLPDLVSGNRGSLDITVLLRAPAAVGAGPLFRRGDADGSGETELTDVLFILEYLFRRGTSPLCRQAVDVNDDGAINVLDPVRLAHGLFREAGILSSACVQDASADALGCQSYPSCPVN